MAYIKYTPSVSANNINWSFYDPLNINEILMGYSIIVKERLEKEYKIPSELILNKKRIEEEWIKVLYKLKEEGGIMTTIKSKKVYYRDGWIYYDDMGMTAPRFKVEFEVELKSYLVKNKISPSDYLLNIEKTHDIIVDKIFNRKPICWD